MDESIEVWRRGNKKEIWECFCGFLDLPLDEFMRVQEEFLLEQIGLLSNSQLGREILGEPVPKTVEEFRNQVKLTKYEAYEHYLSAKREDVLPVKPYRWFCTSGVSGRTKWVPVGETAFDSFARGVFAMLILATSKSRGDFTLAQGDILPNLLAPPPYASGTAVGTVAERYNLRLMPPFDEIKEIKDMGVRVAKVFELGLKHGIDLLLGLPGMLVQIGEGFGQNRKMPLSLMLHPGAAFRILRAVRRAKRAGRRLLPKDLWDFKAIGASGVDIDAHREKITEYWGIEPFEVYMTTEFAAPIACQTWTKKALTLIVGDAFFEFIPEEESLKTISDPTYQPKTLLLNELETGKRYEIVFTNFHGGVFTRYRPGDMLRVTALADEGAGIRLPQFVVEGRSDRLIDIASFTRLDERTIWRALESTGVKYEGWMARKETEDGQPILKVYLAVEEPSDGTELAERIHQGLRRYDSSYDDLEVLLKMKPLRLTLLPWGTFDKYKKERIAAGADPGHLKDQNINPPDSAVERIKVLGGVTGG